MSSKVTGFGRMSVAVGDPCNKGEECDPRCKKCRLDVRLEVARLKDSPRSIPLRILHGKDVPDKYGYTRDDCDHIYGLGEQQPYESPEHDTYKPYAEGSDEYRRAQALYAALLIKKGGSA